MSTLFLPWDSNQQLFIADPGPWIPKEVTKGVFAYCPNCRAFPQTKFGHEERGTIACSCHNTTAEIVERKSVS
jgi:hypothetical protein